MNHVEYLINKYKNKIKPVEHSVDEVISMLKEKVDLKEINLNEVSDIHVDMTKKNIFHYLEGQQCEYQEMDFVVFAVVRNPKSEEYYQGDYVEVLKDKKDQNEIIILAEKNSEYFSSNSEEFKYELTFSQGISKYDYDNDTDELIAYLSYLDVYDELYTSKSKF